MTVKSREIRISIMCVTSLFFSIDQLNVIVYIRDFPRMRTGWLAKNTGYSNVKHVYMSFV